MQKKICCCLLFCCLFSFQCERDFEDNQRLIFSGFVSTIDNLPIRNTAVEVFVNNGSSSFYLDEDEDEQRLRLIGKGFSDATGMFKVISPAPGSSREIVLKLNAPSAESYDSSRASLTISTFNTSSLEDQTYKAPPTILEKVLQRTIRYTRTSSETDTFLLDLSYKNTKKRLNFQTDRFLAGNNININEVVPPERAGIEKRLTVLENDTLKITYQLRNGTILNEKTELILVKDLNETYELEF